MVWSPSSVLAVLHIMVCMYILHRTTKVPLRLTTNTKTLIIGLSVSSGRVRVRRTAPPDDTPLSLSEVVAQLVHVLSPTNQRSPCRSTIYPGGRCACSEITEEDTCEMTPSMDPKVPVCLGPAHLLPGRPCLVYSAGMEASVSFETELARFGCAVHVFHPLADLNASALPEEIQVHALGLSGATQLVRYGESEMKLLTLDELVSVMGHQRRRIDYLKINVADEWDVLRQQLDGGAALWGIPQLAVTLRFPRQVLEGAAGKSDQPNGGSVKDYLQRLKTLQSAGFQLVSSQPGKTKFEGTALSHEYHTFWVRE